jgi:hypothetical protein
VNRFRVKAAAIVTAILSVAGIALGSTPASAAGCSTSDKFGVCYYTAPPTGQGAYNNVWNWAKDPGWTQTLSANAPWQWSVAAKFAAVSGNPVISYPEYALINGTDGKDISKYTYFRATWSSSLPSTHGPTDKYESAFDFWLDNTPGNTGAHEVMAWTKNYKQTPGGTDMGSWPDPTYGNVYEIWANSTTVWFVIKSGTAVQLDVKALLLKALSVQKTAWPNDPGLMAQESYGFEIVNTSNTSETFTLTTCAFNFL